MENVILNNVTGKHKLEDMTHKLPKTFPKCNTASIERAFSIMFFALHDGDSLKLTQVRVYFFQDPSRGLMTRKQNPTELSRVLAKIWGSGIRQT